MTRTQNRAHLFLSLSLLIITFTLGEPLLLWVQILMACAVAMRLFLFFNVHKHLPSIRTINLLAVLSAIGLAYSGWHLGLLLGMINLLAMGCALKLMTMRRYQDYFGLIVATFFLIFCGFIFQQTPLFTFLYSVTILLLLTSLIYHTAPHARLSHQLKVIGIQCLQALPITALLFLIIPQIEPLWRMPTGKSAETGLSETVTPGDIANLSQSSDLAFRATFSGDIPPPEERYWRALVLEDFDGSTWRISPQRKQAKALNKQLNLGFTPELKGPYYQYEVIAEPVSQPWLYSLDIAQSKDKQLWLSQDYQLQRETGAQGQFKYQVNAYYQSPLYSANAAFDKLLNLQTPNNSNPKTKKWVRSLRQKHTNDADFIHAVKAHFVRGDYRYTLQPIAMPTNAIDTLLFDSQAGFCAHYASAMAFIMREAGIPARMVTGYLGGETRGENYMSVYQYDAHAWVEIWREQTGWQRLDPTALVSPERILHGLEVAVAHENTFLLGSPFSLAKLKDIAWLGQLRDLMENVDYLWSRWLLGFDQEKQVSLFASILGSLSPYRIMALTISTLFCIGILLVAFQYRIWFPKINDPLLHHYHLLIDSMTKKGFHKEKSQAAITYAEAILKQSNDEFAKEFMRLTHLFVQLRYANNANTDKEISAFKQQVKHFKKRFK
ncbi:transglutaminase family protein [Alteromonas sp. a30]|uniref:transglutaminase family protein n=1 Tax=Alteromonas sp. a30 TaxID=2730917 RepID=UPI00227F091D|nr:DUF3488 and transglutaminase-like domain-containing protein [Alteromonas sp. a30]MCY7296979.1 DUF3488 domain-containing transglutaminase family protein [Alteromonas sp. a30]